MSIDLGLLAGAALMGLSIAAPVGPIALLIVQRTLAEGFAIGLACGLGTALADALYGALAAFGLVAASPVLGEISRWVSLAGALSGFLLGAVASLIGVQFVSLGLMGEVLTRVYFESQGKRPYVVRERRNIESRPLPTNRDRIAADRESLARLGQGELARAAMKQPDAEISFQRRDVAAHRRRGKRQAACGSRKPAGIRASDEGFEICQGFHDLTFNECLKVN